MAYKKLALYFTLIDQIVYEIITKWFTQPFMSAFLTQLCISKYFRSSYQRNQSYNIQIIETFYIIFFFKFYKKELSVY